METPTLNIQGTKKRQAPGSAAPSPPYKKKSFKSTESWSESCSDSFIDNPSPLELHLVQGRSNGFNKYQGPHETTEERKLYLNQIHDECRIDVSHIPNEAKDNTMSLLGDTSPSASVEAFMDLRDGTGQFEMSIDHAFPETSGLIADEEVWSPSRTQCADGTPHLMARILPCEDRLLFSTPPFHPVESKYVDTLDFIDDPILQNDKFEFGAHPIRPNSTQIQLPAHVVGGNMINTPQGLAFLAPQENLVQTPDGTAILVLNQNVASEDRLSLDSVGDQGECREGKHWSPNEDTILKHAVETQESSPDWQFISTRFFAGSRSANSCKHRWRKIAPSSNTAKFTDHESEIIIQERSQGKSWSDIAKCLRNRTANQVKFQFEKIDPTRKRSEWSPAEDEFLIAAQSRYGNKWVKISELLPGRSSNDVKNRWNRLRRQDDSLQSTTIDR